ncbi:hypothetical protein CNR22_23040 [Sphingobacteriaceae bacterium]|nr:hypothetical protein CNR22_23040 [Sphingobacteriaceae bacterium]
MYIELTKSIHKQMSEHQFVVSIMGNFNQDFLKSLIKMTDNKLTTLDLNESVKKRIFHFVVECAQNICTSDDGLNSTYNSLFLIGKKKDDYLVYLGSVFDNHAAVRIQKLIAEVNAMTTPDLKEKLYQEMIKKENTENHLLMSLLDLSKRTKEKISCDEFIFDTTNKFLSFKITLSNF